MTGHACTNDPALGVGARLPRKEDARHSRGRGQFVSDFRLAGTRDVAFVRAAVAHARIRSIEVPPEIRERVFLAADFPDARPIAAICDIPGWRHSVCHPLARDKVRFVGQPIAACLAPTRAEAEDLADAVIVEYDELPAVTDARAALEPGAPILHDGWDDNAYIRKDVEAGDIEGARQAAAVVVKREYKFNR